MNRWEKFVDSFSTPGGCILLLSTMVLIFSGIAMRLIFHTSEISQTMGTTVDNILMAFVGALVQALQSRAKSPERDATVHTETLTIKDTPKET